MQDWLEEPSGEWLGRVVLDRLPLGIAVLDAASLIHFANVRVLELFGSADIVARSAGGRLRILDGAMDRKFRRILDRIASNGPAAEGTNEILVLQRPRSTQIPLVVALCGLATESPAAGPHVLVTFADAADALCATSIRRLGDFFGLTPAEQRLTQYLASGGRLGDAAREFGVSPHTVRNQLRAVFEKSGVQRQSDLTRLVMTGAAANFPAIQRQSNNRAKELSHAYH